MSKTLQELARVALSAQDASNINIVLGFVRSLEELRELHRKEGSEFFNTHPIMVLWADKVATLTGAGNSGWGNDRYAESCEWCRSVAQGDLPRAWSWMTPQSAKAEPTFCEFCSPEGSACCV